MSIQLEMSPATESDAQAFGPSPATEDLSLAPEASSADAREAPPWSLPRRVGFRFLFVYLILYCLPFPLAYLPRIPLLAYFGGLYFKHVHAPAAAGWDAVVGFIGTNLFAADVARKMTGSGDTARSWVEAFTILVIALVATALWTLIDRRRTGYALLDRGLRVYARFYLALVLLGYGMAKVIQSQFPAPSLNRLLQPYGESSPMGLLWTFMGASYGYNLFSGLAEVIPAILLTFRRTAQLGALLAIAVMTNILVLNLCYDVPVKLFSAHLLVISIYVAAPALGRLVNLLVLARPAAPLEIRPFFRRRWMDLTLVTLRTLIIGLLVAQAVIGIRQAQAQWGIKPDSTPLYGVWEVEEFIADGEELPALITDEIRWRRVIFERENSMAVHRMTGFPAHLPVEVDLENQTLTLIRAGIEQQEPARHELKLAQPEPDLVVLEGFTGTRDIKVTLRRRDISHFLLTSRGFHWVSEYPYNR